MAGHKAALPPLAAVNREIGGSMVVAATATLDKASPFDPSLWKDFFVTYTPPELERSEDWMRKRADQLKVEVHQMFETSKSMSTSDVVTLVDALERLGIDNHFNEEIDMALSHAYNNELEFGSYNNDLHVVALWFRILRQHGFWVSSDVFDKFKDNTGKFKATLSNDPRGLLSLYNAAHLIATHSDEQTLDEAISFSRHHLKSMKGKLMSPMAEQVSRALDIPLPRAPKRLETVHYITEYGKEDTHDDVLLELARLDFDIVRSLHIKELKTLSLWWRDLYDDVKLSYARDRLVENYFWTCGILHEEEYSRARMLFSKTMGLFSLMDDTYDVHATLEECHKLTEAIERWDESAISILPEYLRKFYLKLLRQFKEFENSLKPNEKYCMSYITEASMSLAKYYLREAKWSNENFMPGSKEHLEVSIMSSGFQPLAIVALMGMGDVVITKRVFDWAIGYPDEMKAGAAISRFLNDIASYKLGKNKKDAANSVECYMNEHHVTGEEAVAAISACVEDMWRKLNRASMEIDQELQPLVQLVVKIARTNEIMYHGGRDAYTFGKDLKDHVTSLFLKPVLV
ncbi:unnamed protein product [Urochloa humidicola]